MEAIAEQANDWKVEQSLAIAKVEQMCTYLSMQVCM